jgi:hypothetical protein
MQTGTLMDGSAVAGWMSQNCSVVHAPLPWQQ